ncbi:MAG: CYTH domain-containing protein [Patescibacteria group bacterium]|jgi:predicted adenylyl cyclase CyaB
MIEVEKKFIIDESDIALLAEGAEFVGKKTFTDVYYDTTDYLLTARDHWLRFRDGRPELKVPMSEVITRSAEQYEEMEDESQIRKLLNLPEEGRFEQVLNENGFAKFCVCTTTRQKYTKDGFIIDLDEVRYPEFVYKVGEIELLVKDKTEMEEASQKIIAFAKANGIKFAPVRGKVIEYLKRIRPEHYRAMVEAKVIIDY